MINRRGQDGYEKNPTRLIGEEVRLVALGDTVEVSIAASTSEMQRISIDGNHYLVSVPPGDTLVLGDNPCNGWELSAASRNVNLLEPPAIACAANSDSCPKGYAPSPLPGLASDPVCSGDERRCAKVTGFVTGARLSVDEYELAPGAEFQRGPTVCDWAEVTSETDRVRLYPGVGERWRLTIRDGTIVGVSELPVAD